MASSMLSVSSKSKSAKDIKQGIMIGGSRTTYIRKISSLSEEDTPGLVDFSDEGYDYSDDCVSVCSSSSEKSLAAILNVNPYHSNEKKANHRPLVVGHRGALYLEPENTLEAFQTSADLGCDGVELDVFLLKCGNLVVFHGSGGDKNPGCLREYCGVEGSILDYTAEDAKKLPFYPEANIYPCPGSKLEDASIPLLEEVLQDAKMSGITVKIELKGYGTEEPVLELVERMGMVDQCHFSSFHHDRVEKIRKLRPQRNADGTHKYKTGCLFDEVPDNFVEIAKQCDASEVHLRYDTCTKQHIQKIHDAGMESMAWFRGPLDMQKDSKSFFDVGDEDEAMYQTVLNSGVKALCINKPDVLLNYLS